MSVLVYDTMNSFAGCFEMSYFHRTASSSVSVFHLLFLENLLRKYDDIFKLFEMGEYSHRVIPVSILFRRQ